MSDEVGLLSIGEAAKQVGVSRRTIERWIKDGKLYAAPTEADRRRRLVNLEDVKAVLVEQQAKPSAHETLRRTKITRSGTDDPAMTEPQEDDARRQDQELVDKALLLVYHHSSRLQSQLSPDAAHPLSLDQLRQGPLGHDLNLIMQIARGERYGNRFGLLEAVESILQLLFWPAAADDYRVPLAFWSTGLGRKLMAAKFRVFKPNELVTIEQAAQEFGVSRASVQRWMQDRTLNYVIDEQSGCAYVIRRDVDNLKRVAIELGRADSERLAARTG